MTQWMKPLVNNDVDAVDKIYRLVNQKLRGVPYSAWQKHVNVHHRHCHVAYKKLPNKERPKCFIR